MSAPISSDATFTYASYQIIPVVDLTQPAGSRNGKMTMAALNAAFLASLTSGTGVLVNAGTISSTLVGGSGITLTGTAFSIASSPTITVSDTGPAPMVVNSNTAVPAAGSHTILQLVGKDANTARLEIESFGGTPVITYRRADGTKATPTAVILNDNIGGSQASAYNGSAYAGPFAAWSMVAAENWGTAASGAYQTWSTTAKTTTTLTERARLTDAGAFLIGTTAAVGSELFNVNAGLALIGTINVGGSGAWSALGPGLGVNSGTIQCEGVGTITLSGTTTGTITPTAGVSHYVVNNGTAAGTLSIGAGLYYGQKIQADITQGVTAHTLTHDSTVIFGLDITSYTATATAGAVDEVVYIWNGAHWRFSAVNHGFAA